MEEPCLHFARRVAESGSLQFPFLDSKSLFGGYGSAPILLFCLSTLLELAPFDVTEFHWNASVKHFGLNLLTGVEGDGMSTAS